MSRSSPRPLALACFILGLAACLAAYFPGLSGGFMFDDYPNIVDNRGVQPDHATLPELVSAALSSPSSELKRPMASLSFAANYLSTGLTAGPMKITNLVIHLLNGIAALLFIRRLLRLVPEMSDERREWLAITIVVTWMLLPINVTAVLYIVQRMESLANLFVLLGLWGYLVGRDRMRRQGNGFFLATGSIIAGTALGVLAKETAVMMPLYAVIIEAFLLRMTWRRNDGTQGVDRRLVAFFVVFLAIPILAGASWLLPRLLSPSSWVNRDFTLSTRLLSEARIVVDYIAWTLAPTPSALSFYHDDFEISSSLFRPPTTILSMLVLALMMAAIVVGRRRRPLFSTGLALYLGSHLLTGTVIPLELIYEHRNYFPSLALLVALAGIFPLASANPMATRAVMGVFGALAAYAGMQTWQTAHAWRTPLDLSRELARRAPNSPRAQYELGRAYIIDSHYDRASPSTPLAYAPLERAASLPGSTILPLQALVFFDARLGKPSNGEWWRAMIEKLKERRPGVEDESSLIALTQCMKGGGCDLPKDRMHQAYEAAISHGSPSGRILSSYADFAWNVLDDEALGEQLARDATHAEPKEPVYLESLANMQIHRGHLDQAEQTLAAMRPLNYGGRLDRDIGRIRKAIDDALPAKSTH